MFMAVDPLDPSSPRPRVNIARFAELRRQYLTPPWILTASPEPRLHCQPM